MPLPHPCLLPYDLQGDLPVTAQRIIYFLPHLPTAFLRRVETRLVTSDNCIWVDNMFS